MSTSAPPSPTAPSRKRRLRWAVRERAVVLRDLPVSRRPRPAGGSGLLVLSPHLDDAVLSCGQLLAGAPGAEVVTLFTGGPPSWDGLTAWDEACGFRRGDDVMAVRRREDDAALALLAATPRWHGLTECQYDSSTTVEEVAAAVEQWLPPTPGATVLVPLGLSQPDHLTLGQAWPSVALTRPDLRWHAYADQPYAELYPEELDARLAALAAAGWHPTPAQLPTGDRRRKRAAIARYTTQMRALRGSDRLALKPERYWLVTRIS